MFAYLLIIFELSFLYVVFWYVFIREPKPLEIKENIWGYYQQPADASTGCGITDESRKSRSMRNVRRAGHPEQVLLRSTRHGVRRKNPQVMVTLKSGWVESDDSKPASTVSQILGFIGAKLTQLSVKLS